MGKAHRHVEQGQNGEKSRHERPRLSAKLARQLRMPPSLIISGFKPLPQLTSNAQAPQRYLPAVTLALAASFLLLALLPWLPVKMFPLLIALLASLWALNAAIRLFKPHPQYGPWPANRAAALVMSSLLLDYWLRVFGVISCSFSVSPHMLLNLGLFMLVMGTLFLYFYQRLHIGKVVKFLLLKSLCSLAAFVLLGGLGNMFGSAAGAGFLGNAVFTRPSGMSRAWALAACAELAVVLIYLLRYRKKMITSAQGM